MPFSFMATKNFCDICDKPATTQPEPVTIPAHTLNQERSLRYNNYMARVTVCWSVENTYTGSSVTGHICKDCLIEALQKHLNNLKQ